MSCPNCDYDINMDIPRCQMGHAYKILLVIYQNVPANPTVNHEVLHYIDENAAEDAFEAISKMPPSAIYRIDVVKLYNPAARYRVQR